MNKQEWKEYEKMRAKKIAENPGFEVDADGTVHDKCGTPECCGECATAGKYTHESDNSLNSKEKKVPQLNQ